MSKLLTALFFRKNFQGFEALIPLSFQLGYKFPGDFQCRCIQNDLAPTPLILAALGILASIVGTFFVRTSKTESSAIHNAFNRGLIIALALVVLIPRLATILL